jgi:antitoxin (DNA-binding transcriptional repressor) of toxin-antitoxin stability system
MATSIDIGDLPERLDEAIELVSAGREVLLFDGSTSRARIVPLTSPLPRTPGPHPGAMQSAPDFDASLPDEFWAGQS